MKLRTLIRNARTGQITTEAEEDANPAGTVRETYGDANARVELIKAAEAVLQGAYVSPQSVRDDERAIAAQHLERLRVAVEAAKRWDAGVRAWVDVAINGWPDADGSQGAVSDG